MYRYLTEGGCNINRGSYQKAYQTEEQVYETRQALSDLFGGPGAQAVAFTRNVTEKPQCAAQGLFAPG
ncbi:MAG: aminotransferase class V-fold PLP-dependent enzyme [Dysosmobacter sp.]